MSPHEHGPYPYNMLPRCAERARSHAHGARLSINGEIAIAMFAQFGILWYMTVVEASIAMNMYICIRWPPPPNSIFKGVVITHWILLHIVSFGSTCIATVGYWVLRWNLNLKYGIIEPGHSSSIKKHWFKSKTDARKNAGKVQPCNIVYIYNNTYIYIII